MPFDDKDFIAKKIRLARKQAKLTQEELAEKIGITAKQLSRIEVGTYTPSLPTFLKIIQELKIDLKDFGIDNKNRTTPVRDEFLKFIYKTPDDELLFYLNCIKTMSDNLTLIRKAFSTHN